MTIQMTFRDFPPTDAIRSHVEKHAAKLLERVDNVVSAHVTLSMPHRHHQHGNAFHVTINVVLPGDEILVCARDEAEGHVDLYVAINDAFDDAARQMREHARIRRADARAQAAE
jgi:ribosomal subunit interface protein